MNIKKHGTRFFFMMVMSVLFIAWLFPNPWLFSTELQDYDEGLSTTCENLRQKMTVQKRKNVRFFVSYGLLANLVGVHVLPIFSNHIYFGYIFIKTTEYFGEITAHELGHVEYNTSNQIVADLFAMRIFGKEKIMKARGGQTKSYRDALSLCYGSDGKNCPSIRF